VRISRPTAIVRVRNLDEAVTVEEVEAVVVARCVAQPSEVRASITRSTNVMGLAWVRCPIAAADDLAKAGRIRVGWSTVRVDLTAARPSYCFKCWREGHVAARCSGKENRSRTCYRCGVAGHIAPECRAAPCCLLCSEAGGKADHKMGGAGYNLVTGRVPPTPIARRKMVAAGNRIYPERTRQKWRWRWRCSSNSHRRTHPRSRGLRGRDP